MARRYNSQMETEGRFVPRTNMVNRFEAQVALFDQAAYEKYVIYDSENAVRIA